MSDIVSEHLEWLKRYQLRLAREKEVRDGRKSLAVLGDRISNHLKLVEPPKDHYVGNSSDWYVYIIKSDAGPIKIGKSIDPIARMRALQTSQPFKLSLFSVIRLDHHTSPYNVSEVELDFHQWLKEYRIRGEWFNPEALTVIEEKIMTNENHLKRTG